MSLNEFVNNWLGKRTDYDHVYQYQCVDLILQYLADCYGITSGVWGNAIDYWTSPTPTLMQHFERAGLPAQGGDIVILNGLPGNPYGHIMVAINSTTAIEQNGQTGDGSGTGGDAVRYRTIPTDRVAGLLRPITKGNEDVITQDDLYPVRVVMSEIEGWNSNDIHSGKDDDQIMSYWVGQKWSDFIMKSFTGQPVHRQNISDSLDTSNAQVTTLTGKLDTVTSAIADRDRQIASLKAQSGDNTKWETLKALVRELVGVSSTTN